MRTFRIRDSSLNFRAPVALLVTLALWLQPVTGFSRADHTQSTVDGIDVVAPATPAVAFRIAESARNPRHQDTGHFPAILQPGLVDSPLVGRRRAVTERDGVAARHSLALTFPYDATAPPVFLHA